MQMGILLAVALGGALGSLARYFVAGTVQSAAWPGFPWGIFVVNISGGFIMGVIVELSALKSGRSLRSAYWVVTRHFRPSRWTRFS